MRIAGICMLLLIFGAIQSGCKETHILAHPFFDIYGESLRIDSAAETNKAIILAFISPECPLCVSYARAIGQLADTFKLQDIAVIGVVSGTYYTPKEIGEFIATYDLNVPVLIDSSFVLSRHYKAKFTPEVHLIDKSGKAHYAGAIDNWAISLGQKRIRPTAHYLADAVENYLAAKPIDPKKTEAVGCFIE